MRFIGQSMHWLGWETGCGPISSQSVQLLCASSLVLMVCGGESLFLVQYFTSLEASLAFPFDHMACLAWAKKKMNITEQIWLFILGAMGRFRVLYVCLEKLTGLRFENSWHSFPANSTKWLELPTSNLYAFYIHKVHFLIQYAQQGRKHVTTWHFIEYMFTFWKSSSLECVFGTNINCLFNLSFRSKGQAHYAEWSGFLCLSN